MHKSTPGFSLLPTIAILAVISLAAFIGWRVYDTNTKNNSNSQTSSNTQSTNQSSSTQNIGQQSTQTTDPNAGYLVIPEWGVRLKPIEGLDNLQVQSRTSQLSQADEEMFITDDMLSLNTACSGQAEGSRPLGALVRTQVKLPEPGNKQLLNEIGGYFYYYYAPASSCSPDENNEAIQSANLAKVKESIKTLEASK